MPISPGFLLTMLALFMESGAKTHDEAINWVVDKELTNAKAASKQSYMI